MLTSVSRTLSAEILRKVRDDFRQSDLTFSREQSLHYVNLLTAADLIGENTSFIANVELDSPADTYQIVELLSGLTTVDLFIVTNPAGRVLAWLGDPERFGEDLTWRPSVDLALDGGGNLDYQAPELWHEGEELYQVASVPIWRGGEDVIGALVLGKRITQIEAQQLKGNPKRISPS